jgi:hypothetical protein
MHKSVRPYGVCITGQVVLLGSDAFKTDIFVGISTDKYQSDISNETSIDYSLKAFLLL